MHHRWYKTDILDTYQLIRLRFQQCGFQGSVVNTELTCDSIEIVGTKRQPTDVEADLK